MKKSFILPVLALTFSFQLLAFSLFAADELPKDILSEVTAKNELPKGSYKKIDIYEGEALQHQEGRGREADDALALNKKAWLATPDDDQSGHVIFGPYVELDEGKYVALFRVKMIDDAGEDQILTLDACVDYGQNVLQQKDLMGTDLKKGKYVQVPVVFDYPGGKLETRAFWQGTYAVAIDSISLFLVK